jgi:hypothetical protein
MLCSTTEPHTIGCIHCSVKFERENDVNFNNFESETQSKNRGIYKKIDVKF